MLVRLYIDLFFLNNRATTKLTPFPLQDALPICDARHERSDRPRAAQRAHAPVQLQEGLLGEVVHLLVVRDRKSTRLNSSHTNISYAVFCLKKKKYHSSLPPSTCTRHITSISHTL